MDEGDVAVIRTKRIYEEPSESDGFRVLVDRLWPRGVSKEDAALDTWRREVAPSDELRELLHGDGEWDRFREMYGEELERNREAAEALFEEAGERDITLLYASRDEERNNAVVLKQFLEGLKG